MNTTTTEPLIITRLIKASRERVYTAWTTPEMAKWICTGEREIISANVDARVGGDYKIHVKSKDHGDVKFSGVFRELKSPSKVVLTWNLGDCFPDYAGQSTQITVDLTEQKGGTLVTLTHVDLPTDEIRDGHSRGWNGSLDNLEKLV
jgi:uncharacterized protein YndB with AHSA1/START domain